MKLVAHIRRDDIGYEWHFWSGFRTIDTISKSNALFPVFLYLKCKVDIDTLYTILVTHPKERNLHVLRYLIENGITIPDTSSYDLVFQLRYIHECITRARKEDAEYRKMIMRYAPEHMKKIQNV